MASKRTKFRVGDRVDRSGFEGFVTKVYPQKGNVMEGCDVKLRSGECHVAASDLKRWRKR